MLDSSPMPTYQPPPAPSKTRSLKRSASVASLPTPPRSLDKTQRKGHVKRRRGDETGSDTDGEVEEEATHIPKPLHGKLDFGVKPLKLATTSTSTSNDPFLDVVVEPTKSQSQTPIGTAPLSPEKSPSPRGKASRVPPLTPSPTRITRATAKKLNLDMPIRDSPNNPFLDSQHNGLKKKRTVSSSKLKTSTTATTTTTASPKVPYEEQPTLTYVFRGQKTEFVNPHYKLSKEALLASQLPVEHVDYEASETLKPMKLFKEEISKRKKAATPEREGSASGGAGSEPKTPKTPKTPRTPVRGKAAVKASGGSIAAGGGGGGWSSSEEESSPKPKTPKRRITRRT